MWHIRVYRHKRNDKPPGPLHDELVFERLDDARLLRHYENNAKTWAAPLSTTDFLDVHFRMSTLPGEARSFEIWALRKPDDPLGIISSCATYLRDAIMCRGKGVRVTGAVIISEIYTDPEHRGRGFAKLLLKRVQECFDKRDDLDIDFTVIFGNGCLNWYLELGWKPVPATQLTINVDRFQTCSSCEDAWEYLTLQEVYNIANCDVNVSKLRLSKAQGPKTHVQILPSAFMARHHLFRSALLAYKLGQDHADTRHYGVSILEDEATEVSAWWIHDFQNGRLMIGRLYVTRLTNADELVVEVLEAAMGEAGRRGLREVVLWDPSPQVVMAGMEILEKYETEVHVTTGERHEMVPCVRWKGGEERDVVLEEGHFVSWS
ncbi:hypothetical protein CDV36_007755 [Fusarium kuroshium]|uniref:LYC1 C-terminal domain-containing protein n=1 Tax=Fusarium kuroshium TaxID=2010991 RepID=A0A3M2S4V9_9HYPO|nr:hypothetical protein CDV36_007755 [Fusarium kuroshium]